MIALEVDTSDLTRMEKSLGLLLDKQYRFAAAQALNDCTRAASVAVNKAMPEIFDRPTAFTDNAAVAPRALAATRDSLISTVTLRDVQARYLKTEEEGGTRTAADNTRKPGSALVLPGATLQLNDFGNIPDGALKDFKSQSKENQRKRVRRLMRAGYKKLGSGVSGPIEAPENSDAVIFLAADTRGNKAAVGGYFRRLAGGHLARLTAFEPETHYHARMGYHARVKAIFTATWVPAMARRFAEAISSAR